jgi:hypothetical protein
MYMYRLVVLPLGRSVSGVIADLRKDPRFAKAKIACVSRVGDQLEAPPEVTLVVPAESNGTMSEQNARLIRSLIKGAIKYDETENLSSRAAFVLNGGTTPQAVVIFKLWQEDDASCRDAFDVQRDGVISIKDMITE